MSRKGRKPPQTVSTPTPTAAATSYVRHDVLRAIENRRWGGLFDLLPGLDFEVAEDLRKHESELVANGGSEFSFGAGTEAPWTARRAAAQRRLTTPDEPGGRYHGKSPRIGEFWRFRHPDQRPRTHGSRELHRFLNRNG